MDAIFKTTFSNAFFFNENVWYSNVIPPKFDPKVWINNIPALVQIMVWRRPGDKPLSYPMMFRLLTHICVIRPQWVKGMILHNDVTTTLPQNAFAYIYIHTFLACSRACASKVFSLRADCGRVIVYPGLKQWERPRHNIFGVCTWLAGGVCMSISANSSASKHLTVTKIVWKIAYVTFDHLISHFFKILSLEFMANLFRDFRASVSLKVFHYRLRGKWCQYDLEIN